MRRRLQVAMVVLALTTFLGACGGGDDDDEDAAPVTTAATATTAPPATSGDSGDLAGVFQPLPGYAYVDLPEAVLQQMESELTADPEFSEVIESFEARSLTRDGEGVAIVMAMALDPRYAALPGVEDGILEEFAESAASTRTVSTAGEEVTVATDADGTTYVVWVDGSLVVMVIGADEAILLQAATELITANQ